MSEQKPYCAIHLVEICNGVCGYCEDYANRMARAGAEILDAMLQSQGYVRDIPAWANECESSSAIGEPK